jgi:hypothetical protein
VGSWEIRPCNYLMPIQEIQLFPIPQTCASTALGTRKLFCSFANHCLPPSVQVLTLLRASRSKVCTSSPRYSFLTVGLLRSICVVLPKLRALPCTPRPMGDCAAGVSRAPCHLPQETQRLESGKAHGRALYLDGTPLKAPEGVIDHPKGGWSFLTC